MRFLTEVGASNQRASLAVALQTREPVGHHRTVAALHGDLEAAWVPQHERAQAEGGLLYTHGAADE